MFGSKWRKLADEYAQIVVSLTAENALLRKMNRVLLDMLDQHKSKPEASAFTQAEIDSMIRLCHPDRHGGSPTATKITQKLLSMRAKD